MEMKKYMQLPLLPHEKRRLFEKIESARTIISEAMRISDRWYVSCSFGKDSTVLLHIVIQLVPEIDVVFLDSNYCFPETYEVRDRFKSIYDIKLTEIKQEIDYMEMTEEFGLSCDRTPEEQARVVQKLKKNPLQQFADGGGFVGCFWGLRAFESCGRRRYFKYKGHTYKTKSGFFKCSPIWDWSWEDIWRYVKYYNLPYNSIYIKDKIIDKKEIRNSSYLTMDAAPRGYAVWLRYYYPSMFNRLANKFPELRRYT